MDLKGRIVATFDQKTLSPEEVLVAIERPFVQRLKKHLEKYFFLTDTTFKEEPCHAYYDLTDSYKIDSSDISIPQKTGKLILTTKQLESNVNEEQFTLFRLQTHWPVQGIDYDQEVLLEVGDEEFVSYTKGCYLGQEIIARIHHRGQPARRLVVLSEEECLAKGGTPLTSKALDPVSGRMLGFSFVKNNQPC